MSDSLNVYLNTMGTQNIFVPQTTTPEPEESVDDYNFISKTYNPTVESTDEDGDVQIEEKSENKSEKKTSVIKNIWSGTKTMWGGSIGGVATMVADLAKAGVTSTLTVLKGVGQGTLGTLQVLSTPIVGPVKSLVNHFKCSINGFKQIFQGKILKGIGTLAKGVCSIVTEPAKWLWSGVKKIGKGVANVAKGAVKCVASVGKAIGKGIAKVGKAIGNGIKKIFKGW